LLHDLQMQFISNWYKARSIQQRRQLKLGAILLAALLGLWFSNQSQVVPATAPAPNLGTISSKVRVHVVGAVASPGLYELEAGSIANDAIVAAGGFTQDALQQTVNLARVLSDGEQLLVRAQGEFGAESANGLISLNLSSATDLEQLPGIGPALAKRIVQYREQHGSFGSLEELTSVSGIGSKLFGQIQDLLTL
jgi:competence protein ComEA